MTNDSSPAIREPDIRRRLLPHITRFLLTLNGFLVPIAGLSIYFLVRTFPEYPERCVPGLLIGLIGYRCLEWFFHYQMHVDKWSPFYESHHHHHNFPTPETGVPRWWVFVLYTTITLAVCRFPLFLAIWTGVLLMLCAYEWIHFLCHCNYKPKTKWGWKVRVNHLTHHNLDETTRYELLFPKRSS